MNEKNIKQPIIFGTDGWRALLDSDMNEDAVAAVAQAFADYLYRRYPGHSHSVGIAYDGRRNSLLFAELVADILSANGCWVFLSREVIPTPVLSHFVKFAGLQAGIMITASHNPPAYNGIKFKDSYGGPFMTEETAEIEALLYRNPVNRGGSRQVVNMLAPYLEFVRNYVDLDNAGSAGLKVAVDSMHGAGGTLIRDILNEAGISCDTVAHSILEDFGGRYPEPVEEHLQPLKELLSNGGFSVGFATDGDADRLGVLIEDGSWLTAHETILLLTDHMINTRNAPGAVVKSTSVTEKLAFLCSREHPLIEVQVGFKYICEEMIRGSVALGCEESGGYGFYGHVPERDGILSALLLVEALLRNSCRTISELLNRKRDLWQGSVHYHRVDLVTERSDRLDILPEMEVKPPREIFGNAVLAMRSYKSSRGTTNGLKFILPDNSWLLLRASETEPLIRIYAEAGSHQAAVELVNTAAGWVNG